MTKTIQLDEEESLILDAFERGQLKSVDNLTDTKKLILNAAKNTQKKRAISIRLADTDIRKIRAQALEEGIPYQTFIGSILHKYVSGKIVEHR